MATGPIAPRSIGPGEYRGREFHVKGKEVPPERETQTLKPIETNQAVMNLKLAKLDRAIETVVGNDKKAFDAIRGKMDMEALARVGGKDAQALIDSFVMTEAHNYQERMQQEAEAKRAAKAVAKKIA